MTLDEIGQTLPNGFHDATIMRFERDLEKGTVTIDIDILVGTSDDPPNRQSAYSLAELVFYGTALFTIDPPDPQSAFRGQGAVWISDKLDPVSDDLQQMLDPGLLTYSIFVLDWHACINIAARDISFRWMTPLPVATAIN